MDKVIIKMKNTIIQRQRDFREKKARKINPNKNN